MVLLYQYNAYSLYYYLLLIAILQKYGGFLINTVTTENRRLVQRLREEESMLRWIEELPSFWTTKMYSLPQVQEVLINSVCIPIQHESHISLELISFIVDIFSWLLLLAVALPLNHFKMQVQLNTRRILFLFCKII